LSNPYPITRALISAISHSTEPMVLTDPRQPDDPVVAINAAFSAMTGFSEYDIVGHNCRILQGKHTDPEAKLHIRRCLEQQRGCIEWVLNYRRDGSRFWNLLFISPVFARDGTLLHFFGNQRDITHGLPSGLPDFKLGPAKMPMKGEAELHALLLEILDEPREVGLEDAGNARGLERVVEQAWRLNEVTTRLASVPYNPSSFT
jgi:PAS domain S-box-containing protein